MRLLYLYIGLLLMSCGHRDNGKSLFSLDYLDAIETMKIYRGDSLVIKLSGDDIGMTESQAIKYRLLDSTFYRKYLSANKDFEIFNASFPGGPSVYQYYYGQLRNKNENYRQVLILQIYQMNDTENDLYLLTFDKFDSLLSTVEVASVVIQAEIEPVSSSVIFPDRIVKYEVVTSRVPDNLDTATVDGATVMTEPHNEKFRFCKDSVTKEFTFRSGRYLLTKKDSVRPCEWRDEW